MGQLNRVKMVESRVTDTESGLSLIPTLLFMMVTVFAVVILIQVLLSNTVRGNGNLVQTNLRQALSVGAEDAANQLNAWTNWPEIMAAGGQTLQGYQPLADNVVPSIPTPSFWENCLSANTCVSENVTFGGAGERPFTVLWTIAPSNGFASKMEGYAVHNNGAAGPTQRMYVAFIKATLSGSQKTAVETVILKKSLL